MTELDQLEAQSIFVPRTACHRLRPPGLPWSPGEDGNMLLRLARRAFPGRVPACHVHARRKFPAMHAVRDRHAAEWGLDLRNGACPPPEEVDPVLARAAEALLFRRGIDVTALDGDTLRARPSSDLGLPPEDRREASRRAAAIARVMADPGQAAPVSPRAEDRSLARQTVADGLHEVHADAGRAVCEARDPKGRHAAARAGRVSGFTGVNAPHEPPAAPDLVVGIAAGTAGRAAERLTAFVAVAVPGLAPRAAGAD